MDILSKLNFLDQLMLGMWLINVGIGIWRGFFSELLILVIWGASMVVAILLSPLLGHYFQHALPQVEQQLLVSFWVIFVMAYFMGAVLRRLFLLLLPSPSIISRVFGGLLSTLKTVLVLMVWVFFLAMTNFRDNTLWSGSAWVPTLEKLDQHLVNAMPENMGTHLSSLLTQLPHSANTLLSHSEERSEDAEPDSF